MVGSLKIIACIGLLISSQGTMGYFYNLCVMKKVLDKDKNKVQLVFGLGDYHDKTHVANKKQREYLDHLLRRCLDLKGKLIVEDLSSINNDGKMVCCDYGSHSSEGVLAKLAHKARVCGVIVDNVEYRFCRVAAIAPLLHNIHANPYDFKSTTAISTSALHQEVLDEVAKVKKYNDGSLLNGMYKRIIVTVMHDLARMGFNIHDKSAAQYCRQLNHKNYRRELERLCIFDSALIDAHIMHAIATSGKQLIFVVAGGSHIEHMGNMLKKMGYQRLFETVQNSSAQVNSVLNFNNSASPSEMLPQAIDITVIDKFLKGLRQ